jgi:hypothetical protein
MRFEDPHIRQFTSIAQQVPGTVDVGQPFGDVDQERADHGRNEHGKQCGAPGSEDRDPRAGQRQQQQA